MLQKQAVKPELLELLVQFMSIGEFSAFNLVGGTALALYEGHRISVDIDLFGKSVLNEQTFTALLEKVGNTTLLNQSSKILIYSVNGIKVDFVDYQFDLIDPINIIDGIRIVSKKDIAAMKLNAILGRGSKKDFFDVVQLLKEFSFEQMLSFYKLKYPAGSEFMVLKSMLYFDDAENEPDPLCINILNWIDVKKIIRAEVEKL
jgi:predicted nucleotidyltransferase component of viral defense system